uniref:KIAA0319 like n=1 Tax=Buteo japonicus TaxID=224669 RepID=A0A8C0BR03_9AVES
FSETGTFLFSLILLSKCEPGKILFGGHLRSWEDHHLQLLEGFHTLWSCQTACCQSPTCDAFWFLKNMCIQVNCTMPGMCQANRTGFFDSVLVFLKKSRSTEHLKFQVEGDMKTWFHKWLDWGIPVQRKKRLRRSFQKWSLAGNKVELLKRDIAWELITHPKDYSGEMEGKHSQTLKLSKLTVGLYEFKVIVDGENAHGEGYVNVTVNPKPRVNQPPVAIVSPQFQEISLPTISTVIDGSQSTDDDKIVSYHWEELKGPLREEKVSSDTAILTLTNLVPGNYTFSLTVVDSDGASNSTTANLTVNKAVDYPPVANAGPNQVITLPQNSITLYGNQSTDDHSIVSYEWLLSPNSKGKVMEMQGVRTPVLQLSAMQEGDYTYQLIVTDSAGHQSTAEVTVIVQPENNKPPKADAGPDKELTLPVDSTTLDGSKSSDDQKIVSFLWEKTRGPDGVKLENANSSIATVTGLQVGTYEFTLTVKDERNLQSQSSVNVIVKEEINKPPVAKIAGNVVITLPTNTAELDGSKSSDDKGIVSYLWTRDEGSPAAGEVLNNSDHHPVLLLSNLVEGTYTFHLRVTDAKGESDVERTTVEVKPDPRKNNLVEIILDVNVSQLTERQKGMFIRQIGVLLGVLDSDITVQKIQPYTEQSTKMVFFVQNQPPHQIFKGREVAWTLKNELRKQQSDFLIFRALEINTVTCQLNCSEHGRCDSFTKRCVCDPFWMENFIRVQMGDGESNCEWSVLYVIIASFVIVVAFGILSWMVICCCKRWD